MKLTFLVFALALALIWIMQRAKKQGKETKKISPINWLRRNIFLLIIVAFSLAVFEIISELGLNWKSAGFIILIAGIIIKTLDNVRKGKEINWQAISIVFVAAGILFLAFENPEIKQITEEIGKSTTKPAPRPPYEMVVTGEFVGKGSGGEEAKIHTKWIAPKAVRQGDMITYRAEWVEILTSSGWTRFQGPEVTRKVCSNVGEVTFKAPKGANVYVEVWRPNL